MEWFKTVNLTSADWVLSMGFSRGSVILDDMAEGYNSDHFGWKFVNKREQLTRDIKGNWFFTASGQATKDNRRSRCFCFFAPPSTQNSPTISAI